MLGSPRQYLVKIVMNGGLPLFVKRHVGGRSRGLVVRRHAKRQQKAEEFPICNSLESLYSLSMIDMISSSEIIQAWRFTRSRKIATNARVSERGGKQDKRSIGAGGGEGW